MSNLKKGPNHAQGEGGGNRTKRNGSHLEQGSYGATKQGPSGDHLTTQFTQTNKGGSHLQPDPGLSDTRGVRGAGNRTGHDRSNPAKGKGKPGSNLAQNPQNTKTKR